MAQDLYVAWIVVTLDSIAMVRVLVLGKRPADFLSGHYPVLVLVAKGSRCQADVSLRRNGVALGCYEPSR